MLQGQVAIITGASRGIGRATALALARAGAALLLQATNGDRLTALAAEITAAGGKALTLAGDVTDPAIAEQAVNMAQDGFGRLDLLVNNAGINTRSSTLDMALDDWTRVMDVNLNGTLHFCRAALPPMIAQGAGAIVNVSSTTAKTPHRNAAPAYGASKAAVNYLTMHLAQEMAPHGIRVNAVCPGPTETDMSQQWTDAYRDRVTASVPLGRLGTPEDIAQTILFLCSPASGFITGETLNANGGTYMN
ncbi:SDR family NAD(P)-dependent oxidoreductase [Antarctobacter jejuensis]|uniref:SDR family NAD(P)-dependent oxidoreductase n=1 Tax=Antarctobacter jejuensis TaxID=1439938 RepID=UPI003FD0ED9C